MDLIIVRHGHAVEVGAKDAATDEERYLTAEGRRASARAGKLLRSFVKSPAMVYTSPLVRARQTADILKKALGLRGKAIVTKHLAPGGVSVRLLKELKDEICVLVGHNPDLEELASACLGSGGRCLIELKKAGICWIRFAGRPIPGRGLLKMLVPPKL